MGFSIKIHGRFSDSSRASIDDYVNKVAPDRSIDWRYSDNIYNICDLVMEIDEASATQVYKDFERLSGKLSECVISHPQNSCAEIKGVHRSKDTMPIHIRPVRSGFEGFAITSALDRLIVYDGSIRSIYQASEAPEDVEESTAPIEAYFTSLWRWRLWIPQLVLCGKSVAVRIPADDQPYVRIDTDPMAGYKRWFQVGAWSKCRIQFLGCFLWSQTEEINDMMVYKPAYVGHGWERVGVDMLNNSLYAFNYPLECAISVLDTVCRWGREFNDLKCCVSVIFTCAGPVISITGPHTPHTPHEAT